MFTTIYINNRKEAGIVARIAREYNRKTSVRDLYANDRYLMNVAERLFGANPDRIEFTKRCVEEIKHLRNNK